MGVPAYDEFRSAYASAYLNYRLADGSLLLEDRAGALEHLARLHGDVARLRRAWCRIPLDDDDATLDWLRITGFEARLKRLLGEKGL